MFKLIIYPKERVKDNTWYIKKEKTKQFTNPTIGKCQGIILLYCYKMYSNEKMSKIKSQVGKMQNYGAFQFNSLKYIFSLCKLCYTRYFQSQDTK